MKGGGDVGEGSFSLAGSGNRRQLQIPESTVPTISIWKWISLGQGGDGVGIRTKREFVEEIALLKELI